MLRHLHVSELGLAHLWVCGVLACSAAPPVEVGVDDVRLASAESGQPEPELTPVDELPDDLVPEQPPLPGGFELVDSDFEREVVSEHCQSSFQACGGVLAGTWVVEDNCNPQTRSRDELQSWGKARMALDEAACWDAVWRLRWKWSGELKFEGGRAIDNRERKQQVDMRLDSRCLSASFGISESESVAPRVCDALEDDNTICGLQDGVCLCSNLSTSSGEASGVYGVLGLSVAIGTPVARYEYCVQGDRLIWQEQDGAQRHVVLKRTVDPPPGAVDPVEIPR